MERLKTQFESPVFSENRDIIGNTETLKYDKALDEMSVEYEIERHVYDLVNSRSRNLKQAIQDNSKRLAAMTEQELIEAAEPTTNDQALRTMFWLEVRNCERENRTMNESNIWKGICSRGYWEKLVKEKPYKFTYIMNPVKEYGIMTRVIHEQGLEQLQRIMSANPFKTKQGGRQELDPRIAKIIIEAFKLIDDRVKGKAVEKVAIHKTTEALPTPSLLESKVKELEEQFPDTVDVTTARQVND